MISIHAPARGATRQAEEINRKIRISIHAPARGATALMFKSFTIVEDFNPRSRKGSDDYSIVVYQLKNGISIHAPARGATADIRQNRKNAEFQSTLPQGERL